MLIPKKYLDINRMPSIVELSLWSSAVCCCCRHYWAFKVEPFSYMVKVGVASDSKLLEWFHSPRDTSSPR